MIGAELSNAGFVVFMFVCSTQLPLKVLSLAMDYNSHNNSLLNINSDNYNLCYTG